MDTGARPMPNGKIIQIHESTICELQLALELGHMDEVREIVERMAAIEERERLREIRSEAYSRMKQELAAGNREAAKRHRQNMQKCADALRDYAI